MFTHILLPTDGSALSEAAIHTGIRFARSLNAKVTGLHVVLPFQTADAVDLVFGGSEAEYHRAAGEQAKQYLGVIEHAAQAAGVPCDTLWVAASPIYQAIVTTAVNQGCDCIVMASHGRSGIQGILLGSETAKVLVHTRLPVLVLH